MNATKTKTSVVDWKARGERIVATVEQHHPASKQELAKLCGFSVISLTTALKYLRKQGKVRCEYNVASKRWESTRENPKLAKDVGERRAVIGDAFSRNKVGWIRSAERGREPTLSRLGRERRKHLEELAADVPCELVFMDPEFWNKVGDDGWKVQGEAHKRVNIAFVPHPGDRENYLVGLHEIRHLQQPFVRKRGKGRELWAEMDANFYALMEREGEIGVNDVARVLCHQLYRAQRVGAKGYGRNLIPAKLRDEYEEMLASCVAFLHREGYWKRAA